MVRAHIWLRRKEGMTAEEFRDHWVNVHAPIARDGFPGLVSYRIHVVTRVPEGATAPYDGIAELTWRDRDSFTASMKSEANRLATEDLGAFSSASGLLFVEEATVG